MQQARVTFILRDLDDAFFDGYGESIKGLDNMTPREAFDYLSKCSRDMPGAVSMRVGSGAFRDRVLLNQLTRSEFEVSVEFAPRKGYRLATFTITA